MTCRQLPFISRTSRIPRSLTNSVIVFINSGKYSEEPASGFTRQLQTPLPSSSHSHPSLLTPTGNLFSSLPSHFCGLNPSLPHLSQCPSVSRLSVSYVFVYLMHPLDILFLPIVLFCDFFFVNAFGVVRTRYLLRRIVGQNGFRLTLK